MVYERNTVYASLVGVAENDIYAAVFQLGCKILFVRGVGKHIGNSAPCRCDINLVFGALEATFNGGAACELADARSLERIGDNLAFIIGGEIHQTMIFASVYLTVGLLAFDIIQGENRVILAYGLEFVAHTNHFDSVGNLPFDITGGINLSDRHIRSDFLALRLVKIVFFLQLGGDLLAASEKKILIEPLALLVDIDSHYMDMVPVYVLVLVDYEGLLAEAEFLQIFAGEDFKILIGQLIVGVRIERDMKNWLLVLPVLGIKALKFSAIRLMSICPSAGRMILLAPNRRPSSRLIFSELYANAP